MEIHEELKRDPKVGAGRLVAEYRDRLLAVALRQTGNFHDAEDLVQRTLAQAVARIGQYGGKSSFFSWLCAILFNFRRMDLRAKGRNSLVFAGAGGAADGNGASDAPPDEAAAALASAASDAPDPAETFCAKAEAEALRHAVAALPRDMRTVVELFYFDDLGVAEIAPVVAMPEGTVKYKLHEARRIMRRRLSAPTDAPEPASNK